MKFFMSLFALMFATQVFAAAKEPREIIFACKTKVVGDTTTQIYGRIAEDNSLVDVTYILIHAWDEAKAPIVRKNETWKADETYKPKLKKYAGWNRYKIQENTPDLVGYDVILPSKAQIYALAMKQAKENDEKMVQGDFEAVLRGREDFHDDNGGQEYLKCGTGWLDAK